MITTLMMTTLMMKTWTLISLTRKRRKAAGKAQQKAAAVKRSEACLFLPARGIAAIGGAGGVRAGGARARALPVEIQIDTAFRLSEKVCDNNHSNHNRNHSNHA